MVKSPFNDFDIESKNYNDNGVQLPFHNRGSHSKKVFSLMSWNNKIINKWKMFVK